MMAHADAPCRINTYVDLLEAHTADLARSNMDLEDYLLRYFIGASSAESVGDSGPV